MIVRVGCPAKINPFLSVGPPDPSGYHPLRTIFQAISLRDFLECQISHSERDIITCTWSDLPERNTLTKTLSFLREWYEVPRLRIHLEKNIPAESGLGGGSSNAAGLMRAVQLLCGNPYSEGQLADCAMAVGSDVPFFLIGGRARGEGYGEKLTALADPKESWMVLLRPDVGCPTPQAYRTLDEKPRDWMEFPDIEFYYNDFERVAPCESLDLMEILAGCGAKATGLCGSGSAVYGMFPLLSKAEAALESLATLESISFKTIARTLTRLESIQVHEK